MSSVPKKTPRPKEDLAAPEKAPGAPGPEAPGPEAPSPHKAGFVAIIGAPNAGKSTLMNHYLGQKVAIVSSKPQTTRHKILGVLTEAQAQIVFWDTPGLHDSNKTLNQEMVSKALSALADSDLCLFLVDGERRDSAHQKALQTVQARKDMPLIVAINKADLIEPHKLPNLMAQLQDSLAPDRILAVSAKTGRGLKKLKKTLISFLPNSAPLYDEDTLTDQTLRAITAEYVREAIFELTHQEIPYSTAVTVDQFQEPQPDQPKPLYRLAVTVHVERDSQKKIMIGRGGQTLKHIGQKARLGLESFLEAKVFLSIFVRITDNWTEDRRTLADFGYLDPKEKS
ncbi:MAG: GTPase Era [Deltaproteobacteria bacterium]|jgi:GTP-binding protein Era|nr:GTPase Era [Deltaproteobacteria bacterium]